MGSEGRLKEAIFLSHVAFNTMVCVWEFIFE